MFGLQFIAWAFATLVNPVELQTSSLSTAYFQILTAIPEAMWLIGFSTCTRILFNQHTTPYPICPHAFMGRVYDSVSGMAYTMGTTHPTMLLLSSTRSSKETWLLCRALQMDVIITHIRTDRDCAAGRGYFTIGAGTALLFLCYITIVSTVDVHCAHITSDRIICGTIR